MNGWGDSITEKAFALMLLVLLQGAYALDIAVKEVEANVKQEYNRGFEYSWDLSAATSVTLYDRIALRGGLSYGRLGDETGEVRAFAKAGVVPFAERPGWRFTAHYIYNDLTDYDVSAHTVLAIASYDFFRYRAGMTFGPNFRFTSFFGETALFETKISYSWYYDFVSNERWHLRATIGNYCDFFSDQSIGIGSSSLWLNTEIYLWGNWSVVSEMQLMQRGNEPFSSNIYGVAWRGGGKYVW